MPSKPDIEKAFRQTTWEARYAELWRIAPWALLTAAIMVYLYVAAPVDVVGMQRGEMIGVLERPVKTTSVGMLIQVRLDDGRIVPVRLPPAHQYRAGTQIDVEVLLSRWPFQRTDYRFFGYDAE